MRSRHGASLIGMCIALGLSFGCSQPKPPTLIEQTRAFKVPENSHDWAVLGWWTYLSGDEPAAREAFRRAADSVLGRLGTARLARDRLDQSLVNATLEGIDRADEVGTITRGWRSSIPADIRPTGVVGPISQMTELTLRALRASPPMASPTGITVLGEPHQFNGGDASRNQAGLHLGVWTFKSPTWIRIETPGRMMTWQRGTYLGEAARSGVARRTVLGPVAGSLVIAWEGPGTARLVMVDPPGATTVHRLPDVPERARSADWLQRYLDAEAARSSGDFDRAWEALLNAPQTGAFEAIRAELFEADPQIPRHIAVDRAMEHWRRAIPVQPIRARLRLADLLRGAGRAGEALPMLTKLIAEVPRAEAVHVSYLLTLLETDRVDTARARFANLEAISVDHCAHRSLRLRIFGQSRASAPRLAQLLVRCGRPLQAVRHLVTLGLLNDALRMLDKQAVESTEAVRLRISILIGLGRLNEARVLSKKHLNSNEHQLALDLEGAPLDDLQAGRVRQWALKQVHDPDALAVMDARPVWSPFGSLLHDTEAAIEHFERTGQRAGRATRVLDHSVLYFTADGHSLRRVHEVLAISSRQAAEEFGELALPPDARALLVYTRKADGRIRFAEAIPEKQALSLPGLEAGDYLVAIYSEPGDNGYLYRHGFLSQRAYFADLGIDIFRQYFDVIPPSKIPATVEASTQIQRAPDQTIDELTVLRFSRRGAPAVPVEPRTLDPALFLPSLRVGGGVSLEESLDSFREQVLIQRRPTHDFKAFVRDAVRGQNGAARLRALLRAVRERYSADAGLIEYPVQRGLYDGRGHRALALSAGLEVLGIGHRLYLARPSHAREPSTFTVASDFQVPIIQTDDGTWIYPDHDSGAPGYLPFPLLNGEAVVVWPPVTETKPVKLPATRAVRDGRRSTLRAFWRADGTVEGDVEDVLTGQEAVSISGYLRQLDPAQRPRLVERLLVHVLSTARITHLEPPELMGHDTLVLRYRFEARVGDAMNLGLFPMRPGRTFASLGSRETPLYIDLPAHQRVDIMLRSERPISTEADTVDAVQGAHRFRRTVDVGETRLQLTGQLDIQGGAIQPKGYSDFSTWARRVDRLERVMIKRSAPVGQRSGSLKSTTFAGSGVPGRRQ